MSILFDRFSVPGEHGGLSVPSAFHDSNVVQRCLGDAKRGASADAPDWTKLTKLSAGFQ
jgi:hypothetical protein